jgi:hypothetical protein
MLKTLILSFLLFVHPHHISFMGVEYFPETEMFKVCVKLNYYDFILDYRNSINDDQIFDPSGKIDTTIILVGKYFNDKVQIFAEDKKLKGRLMSIESADGELRMSFLFNNIKKARHFKVKNQILTELYNDQANLLIFKYNDFEEGIKLTSGNKEQSFRVN